MKREDIIKLINDEGLTITDVIDAVIELNGIVGVGFIDLEDHLVAYIRTQRKNKSKVTAEGWMNS